MTAKNTSEIRKLTRAEISSRLTVLHARDVEITNELASRYKNALKNGGAIPIVDSDEMSAREYARALLDDAAPESLSLAPEPSRDKILYREKRGIEIATKILSGQDMVERAAEAVQWAEDHAVEWRTLCHDVVVAKIRLDALEECSRRLLDQCIDVASIRLPMVNRVGGRPIADTPTNDLTEIAMAAGLITSTDIRKAKNV
jgi:hypothetical protein